MQLVTKELAKKLPPIDHFAETHASSVPVIAKFVVPKRAYTFYVWEYDPKNKRFFGLVKGPEVRVGFFTVQSMRGKYAQPDDTWEPVMLSELADGLGLDWIKKRR